MSQTLPEVMSSAPVLLEKKPPEISCTIVVCTSPSTLTMSLRCLPEPSTVMTNIIYANVIRPGNTIAELGVPAEIYHRSRRDSKPSIKILDFSRLNLQVINKAAEERKVLSYNKLIFGVLCHTWKRSRPDYQVEKMMTRSMANEANG